MEPQTLGSFATRTDVNLPGDCNLNHPAFSLFMSIMTDQVMVLTNSVYFEKVKVETGEDDGVEKD